MTERRSATEDVFAEVRSRILTGSLAPGSRHSIYQLADELNVSRTPAREAVLRLADLGLVSIERNRGFVVRGVQATDVREVFELRILLEVPAAARAAERADDSLVERLQALLDEMREAARVEDVAVFTERDRALHAALGEAFGNSRLSREVDRLRDSIQVRGVSTINQSRSMGDIAEEHAPIVDAIAARDPDAAAKAMRDHLERTADLLLRSFE